MDYIQRVPHEINNTKGLTQNVITKGFNILILENVKITVCRRVIRNLANTN